MKPYLRLGVSVQHPRHGIEPGGYWLPWRPIVRSGANETRRRKKLSDLLDEPGLRARFDTVRKISGRVRSSEYHLTNACNIRCDGCWFFAKDFDRRTTEPPSVERWRLFAKEQALEGVSAALLIGGEPTLFPDRIEAFQDEMEFVTVSSNGLRPLPVDGFERVAIALTLFAGVGEDDRLRAIAPSGRRFEGLFERALSNYRNDPRATFIYALDARCTHLIDETVARIEDNGNVVSFNYYSDYNEISHGSSSVDIEARLLEEVLRVTEQYPETVISHP
ncbi:MAG: radical SAM protein, partial [Myxococcota bacterium]